MKTQFNFKKIDIGMLVASVLITLFCWLYVAINYSSLPAEIPSHFNEKGVVDAHSEKYFLWIVLAVFTGLQFLIYLIAKHTTMHNFQLKNTLSNFRAVAVFIPYLAILLCFILYSIIQSAKNNSGFSSLFIPLIIAITTIVLITMLLIIFKNKKS